MKDDVLADLLLSWEEEKEAGREPTAEELCVGHPELLPDLRSSIKALRSMEWVGRWSRPEAPTSFSLAPGEVVPPGFRLVERLGKGGFAEVWKATDPQGRAVALKLIPITDKAAAFEERAFDLLKGLRHPHLLPIYDLWRASDYLAVSMELADQSLDQLPRSLPAERLLDLFRQAAEGIDLLHHMGLQHRDIKPANLLLVNDTLKVADFGLLRQLAHSVSGHTGSMTVAFSAPEFFEGKTTRFSDQYSFAVTYCLLRGGRLPFEGTHAALLVGHLRGNPDLAMLPSKERSVVARALSKRPEDRWPNCRQFVEALAAASSRVDKPTSARRWVAATAMGLALAGMAAAGYFFGRAGNPPADSQVKPSPGPVSREADKPLEPVAKKTPEPPVESKLPVYKPKAVFVFEGQSRIVTNVERFAPVTLEAWVRLRGGAPGSQERYIIGSDVAGRSGISIGMRYTYFSQGNGDWDWGYPPLLLGQSLPGPKSKYPWVPTPSPLPHNEWFHLAGVFGTEKTTFYLNGKAVAVAGPSGGEGGSPFVIGCAGKDNRASWFLGEMGAVRVSKGERYKNNFSPEPVWKTDATTVLLYEATQVEGTHVRDLSNHVNNGMLDGVSARRND